MLCPILRTEKPAPSTKRGPESPAKLSINANATDGDPDAPMLTRAASLCETGLTN